MIESPFDKSFEAAGIVWDETVPLSIWNIYNVLTKGTKKTFGMNMAAWNRASILLKNEKNIRCTIPSIPENLGKKKHTFDIGVVEYD